MQIMQGDLVPTLKRLLPKIAHIQVADTPGRHEPGTGEINYPAIAEALRALGYAGTVGLEAYASGDSDLAMRRFRSAFTKEAI